MPDTILFSYDVLANSQHRQELKNDDWAAYHSAHVDDEPNLGMIALVNALTEFYYVCVYSDMPVTYEQSLTDWLVDNGCHAEEVFLASSFARGSIPAKRLELIRENVDLENVAFVFENNLNVVEALREEGIGVFECV